MVAEAVSGDLWSEKTPAEIMADFKAVWEQMERDAENSPKRPPNFMAWELMTPQQIFDDLEQTDFVFVLPPLIAEKAREAWGGKLPKSVRVTPRVNDLMRDMQEMVGKTLAIDPAVIGGDRTAVYTLTPQPYQQTWFDEMRKPRATGETLPRITIGSFQLGHGAYAEREPGVTREPTRVTVVLGGGRRTGMNTYAQRTAEALREAGYTVREVDIDRVLLSPDHEHRHVVEKIKHPAIRPPEDRDSNPHKAHLARGAQWKREKGRRR